MPRQNRYISYVLVPHVLITAVIFWLMVLVWIFGVMSFAEAVTIAAIAVVIMLLHGTAVAVWGAHTSPQERYPINTPTQHDSLLEVGEKTKDPTKPRR